MPKRGRMRSRFLRCSTSSLLNGMRPERTSSMPGWIFVAPGIGEGEPIERKAERLEDQLGPRAMLVRQSTSVPNTSKNSAFGDRHGVRPVKRRYEPAASMPFDLSTSAAAGPVSALISALAASLSLALAPSPAA